MGDDQALEPFSNDVILASYAPDAAPVGAKRNFSWSRGRLLLVFKFYPADFSKFKILFIVKKKKNIHRNAKLETC